MNKLRELEEQDQLKLDRDRLKDDKVINSENAVRILSKTIKHLNGDNNEN